MFERFRAKWGPRPPKKTPVGKSVEVRRVGESGLFLVKGEEGVTAWLTDAEWEVVDKHYPGFRETSESYPWMAIGGMGAMTMHDLWPGSMGVMRSLTQLYDLRFVQNLAECQCFYLRAWELYKKGVEQPSFAASAGAGFDELTSKMRLARLALRGGLRVWASMDFTPPANQARDQAIAEVRATISSHESFEMASQYANN